MGRWIATLTLAVATSVSAAQAQAPGAPDPRGPGNAPPGPPPTHANLEYAPAEPVDQQRPQARPLHPCGLDRPLPVVIWTGGSAWMADTGKNRAGVPWPYS